MTITRNFTRKQDASFHPLSLRERTELRKLCAAARRLDARHSIPATSSNFSVRAGANAFLISRSGIHKRLLQPGEFIRTGLDGCALNPLAPRVSDETLLHALIYRYRHDAGAVIHCHAPAAESLVHPGQRFEDHELIKAFGFKTHETAVHLPVFRNNQDMTALAAEVGKALFVESPAPDLSTLPAFMLERHGLYVYGKDVDEAELRMEALLHLCAAERI